MESKRQYQQQERTDRSHEEQTRRRPEQEQTTPTKAPDVPDAWKSAYGP